MRVKLRTRVADLERQTLQLMSVEFLVQFINLERSIYRELVLRQGKLIDQRETAPGSLCRIATDNAS